MGTDHGPVMSCLRCNADRPMTDTELAAYKETNTDYWDEARWWAYALDLVDRYRLDPYGMPREVREAAEPVAALMGGVERGELSEDPDTHRELLSSLIRCARIAEDHWGNRAASKGCLLFFGILLSPALFSAARLIQGL